MKMKIQNKLLLFGVLALVIGLITDVFFFGILTSICFLIVYLDDVTSMKILKNYEKRKKKSK